MIYFDNAATTMHKPQCVIDAVCGAMKTLGNSGRAVHGHALDASRTIYAAREKVARLFGCPLPRNVVFTCNATEALNAAIFGSFQPGDHIISTDLEHNSVLRPLYALQRQGVAVDFLPADRQGCIRYEDFAKYVKPNTRAVVCTHASNLTGNLLDLQKIGDFCRENGLLFLVDAAQTAGVFPLHMEKMHIDILCFTGHKSLLGPQGTGGMCLREGVSVRPLKCGGTGVQTYLPHQPEELPTRLEAGTMNGHGIAGLSAALTYLEEIGIDTIRAHELELMSRFLTGIRQIPGIQIYGEFDAPHAPIVSLNWKDLPSGELADALAEEYGIATRSGAHCAPRMHAALGTMEQGAVRFSFGYGNTEDEIDFAVEALRKLCV